MKHEISPVNRASKTQNRYAIKLRLTPAYGYSLPLVVAAALILIAGTAVFANRAGMGLLSSIFQNQSWEAKEAAEIGMTQIVSELNKETNRYLMVKRPGDNNGIWTTSSNPFVAATRTNPCTGATEPSYANLDARTGTTNAADSAYGTWYIQENGEITRTQGNAVRGFKLTAVTRQNIDENGSPLNVYKNRSSGVDSGTGKLILQVQGLVFRGSSEVASADLEKEFELVPKCCKVSFGAAHGGLDYGINSTTNESICLTSASSLGLGLIAGAGLEGGWMELKGTVSVKNSNEQNVSPVICIVAPNTTCTNEGNTSTQVAEVDITLPTVKQYADAFNSTGAIRPSGSSINSINSLTNCITSKKPDDHHECPSNPTQTQDTYPEDLASRTNNFTFCASNSIDKCDTTIVNTGATSDKIPQNCVINAGNTEIHCNISYLKYGNMVVATGSRKLFLYFPENDPSKGQVVEATQGNTGIKNCVLPSNSLYTDELATSCRSATGKDITRVNLFGCPINTCSKQTITLKGNNENVGMFSYFPEGNMDLAGTPNYEGVMWGKTVNAVGTANFVIPAAGLTSVFQMMGMLLNNEATGSTNYGLLAFDFVARATNRYRWL